MKLICPPQSTPPSEPTPGLRDPDEAQRIRRRLFSKVWWLFFSDLTGAVNATAMIARYGTRAERLAINPGGIANGSLFIETDTGLVYQAHNAIRSAVGTVTTPAFWMYVSGTYARTQAQLSALAATLGTNDTGLLVEVTDFRHVLRWTGSAWAWGPAEDGRHDIVALPVDPDDTTGWQLCDGTTVSYLNGDGTTSNFATPDLIGIGAEAYLKLGDTVAGPTAAVAPTVTNPANTGVGAAVLGSASATINVNNAPAVVSVAQGVHNHIDSGHTHTIGNPTVGTNGEPRNYRARPWFRR